MKHDDILIAYISTGTTVNTMQELEHYIQAVNGKNSCEWFSNTLLAEFNSLEEFEHAKTVLALIDPSIKITLETCYTGTPWT